MISGSSSSALHMFNKSGSLELLCGALIVALMWLAEILAASPLLDWEPVICGCSDLKHSWAQL